MNKRIFTVYEFRPDKLTDASDLLRYADGQWIPDDGEYDVAFISFRKQCAYYVYMPHYDNLLWSYCKNGNWNANVKGHPNKNAWHYMTSNGEPLFHRGGDWERDSHTNTIVANQAMEEVTKNGTCGNGVRVEFNILDETIAAGLLRNKETKEVVMLPETFKCIYCGNLKEKDYVK